MNGDMAIVHIVVHALFYALFHSNRAQRLTRQVPRVRPRPGRKAKYKHLVQQTAEIENYQPLTKKEIP